MSDKRIDRVPGVLEKCPLFRGVSRERIAGLIELFERCRLAAQAPLFKEGDRSRAAFIVLEGKVGVRCHILERKDEHIPFQPVIVTFGPGDIVGEFALLDANPRSADAFAMVPSEVLTIAQEAFDRVIADDPALGCIMLRNLAVVLVDRIRRTNAQFMAALEWNWKHAGFDQVKV